MTIFSAVEADSQSCKGAPNGSAIFSNGNAIVFIDVFIDVFVDVVFILYVKFFSS